MDASESNFKVCQNVLNQNTANSAHKHIIQVITDH